jgi:hypothetical protein
VQPLQLQPPFGPSRDLLCHPCITTTHLSYSVLSLKLPPSPCAVLLVSYLFAIASRLLVSSSPCLLVSLSPRLLVSSFPGLSSFHSHFHSRSHSHAHAHAHSQSHSCLISSHLFPSCVVMAHGSWLMAHGSWLISSHLASSCLISMYLVSSCLILSDHVSSQCISCQRQRTSLYHISWFRFITFLQAHPIHSHHIISYPISSSHTSFATVFHISRHPASSAHPVKNHYPIVYIALAPPRASSSLGIACCVPFSLPCRGWCVCLVTPCLQLLYILVSLVRCLGMLHLHFSLP